MQPVSGLETHFHLFRRAQGSTRFTLESARVGKRGEREGGRRAGGEWGVSMCVLVNSVIQSRCTFTQKACIIGPFRGGIRTGSATRRPCPTPTARAVGRSATTGARATRATQATCGGTGRQGRPPPRSSPASATTVVVVETVVACRAFSPTAAAPVQAWATPARWYHPPLLSTRTNLDTSPQRRVRLCPSPLPH